MMDEQEQPKITIDMSENAWVKCSRCGEQIEVPQELLGETKPEEVYGYVCDACDIDFEEEEEVEDWDESDLDVSCPLCGGNGKYDQDEAGEIPCPECNGTGILF